MEIGIALYIDAGLKRLSSTIMRINDRLEAYFSTKEYGEGISSVFIGLILMAPGSERLHPVTPFKYQKLDRYSDIFTGRQVQVKDVVTFDVKPNYESLTHLNSEEAEKYIAEALIEAMGVISKQQEEFPMFNTAQFKDDFAKCLRQ
jgi:hypothetical protein